jgi:hypothetical protein
MRQDQFEALQARGEQLVDVFLAESDPTKWPGHGIAPAAMEKTTRGDRYWCKKDAVATLACAQRIFNLVQVIRERSIPPSQATPEGEEKVEDSLDAEVAAAEKQAKDMLDAVQRGARKAAFDKHVHKKA